MSQPRRPVDVDLVCIVCGLAVLAVCLLIIFYLAMRGTT